MKTVIVVTTVITMTVSAYTSHDEGMRGDGITTSGLPAQDGFCACGPGYEFGTLFAIPDLRRFFICMDRGLLIGDGNLDIWMADQDAALAFGRRTYQVEVRIWVSLSSSRRGTDAPSWNRSLPR